MKKLTFLVIIGSLIFKTSFSQDLGVNAGGHQYAGLPNNSADYISNFDANIKKSLSENHKNIIGSIYINPEFSTAKISKQESNFQLRYDAYNDEMELKTLDDNRYLLKKPELEVAFSKTSKTYRVFSNDNNNCFFVVLLKGDEISLLSKETITFNEESKPETGYDTYSPPTLKRNQDIIYIGYKNNTAYELPSNKKEIIALFSSKSKDIKDFAKINNLNFNKKEDLIKIFEYYNTL